MTTTEWLVVSGAALFLVAQIMNQVSLVWRSLGSITGAALTIGALLIEPASWEAAVFGWFLTVAALVGKWGVEVGSDVYSREEKGRPPLLRNWFGINLYLNPFFTIEYRRRMFRDEWSCRRVLRDSYWVPRLLRQR